MERSGGSVGRVTGGGSRRVFPSKRDGWIVALLWVGVLGLFIAAGALWTTSEPLLFRAGMSVLLAAAGGFALWVLYGTYYILTAYDLVIRSGPFRWIVPLDAITEVYPTRNPLSSPACSLDRLRILHAGSRLGVMISPEVKTTFLQELAAREPGLRVEGERAVREGGGD